MKRDRMPALVGLLLAAALVLASCGGSSAADRGQDGSEAVAQPTSVADEGVGNADVGLDDASGVEPTKPVSPDVTTIEGELEDNVRTFQLTAKEATQKIANFPMSEAKIWGYNGETPGPTLLMNEGETFRLEITNELPPTDPKGSDKPPDSHPTSTTVHFHGLHEPNEDDGVAGISQPDPIPPGETHTYEFKPGHAGTFAYHSHTDGPVQELRGLDGFLIVQPQSVEPEEKVDKDFAMTVQQFAPPGEGELVDPFPPGTGDFPFSTINGKTGEAAGEPITIDEGDKVRVRVYNASQESHAMHLHGHDFTITSKNGHPVAPEDRNEVTTENIAPGEFFEMEFTANNPGNWIFHCHFPHHTSNMQLPGYNGAPVGMTRIFHYEGYDLVPPEYFDYSGS